VNAFKNGLESFEFCRLANPPNLMASHILLRSRYGRAWLVTWK